MSDKPTTEPTNTGNDSDQDIDFDPSADMLVNDFDDEHTLEEEEALEENSNSNEIDELQREGEMPIEELLALYRCNFQASTETANVTSTSTTDENPIIESADTQQEEPNTSEGISESTSQLDNDKKEESAEQTVLSIDRVEASSNLSKLILTSEDAFYDMSDDEEDDEDDTPEEEDNWRRTIQIGPDHQATVPEQPISIRNEEDLSEVDSSVNTDPGMLLWNPKQLNEDQVEFFLKNFSNNNSEQLNFLSDKSSKLNDEISSTVADNIQQQRDDELALFVLFKNSYEIQTALNLLNNKTKLDKEFIDLFTFIERWSDADCDLFEDGLRAYGKDFHQIQKNQLSHKTVNELVNFYYLWKKTERHDMFTSKFRFEKKKYSLNPMTTDLMDHFLDDHPSQPNQTSFNSTSSSLNNSHNSSIMHHNRHHHHRHVSSLTLLPTSNHPSNHHSDNSTGNISSTNLTSSANEAQQTTNEDSNHSSDGRSSSLVINEIVSPNEEHILTSKMDLIECPDSSTVESVVQSNVESNLTNNVTSSTNPSSSEL